MPTDLTGYDSPPKAKAAPPPPKVTPAPNEPTVAYNQYGYVHGGDSAAVGQAIEAQAIAFPGPHPVQVPIGIEASIPPDTLVSTPEGGVETFQQAVTAGPPAPTPQATGTLSGLGAVDELFRLAGLHNIDPLAAAANALHEGAGGGIGDSGTAYGPWQIHATDGRIPAFTGMAKSSPAVQAWAWSADGFAYAFRSMVEGGASGLTRHPAVHAIVYGFERPADEAGAYAIRSATYDDLASYSGDIRALLAPKFVGVGSTISGTGLPGPASAAITRPAQPRPAGVGTAWDDLLTLAETGIPRSKDAVESLGASLIDVFR